MCKLTGQKHTNATPGYTPKDRTVACRGWEWGGECAWERGSAGPTLSVLQLIYEGQMSCLRKEGGRQLV